MSETSNQHSGQDHTRQKTVRVRASELIGRSWLNTGEKKLDLQALRGKIVILDFWTLCCINCLHVLDELRPLEEEFSDVLVTVGVHSPKFEHEADPVALAAAVDRYDIQTPRTRRPRAHHLAGIHRPRLAYARGYRPRRIYCGASFR